MLNLKEKRKKRKTNKIGRRKEKRRKKLVTERYEHILKSAFYDNL